MTSILSLTTISFYFNRADFEASEMVPVIEEVSGMSEVQRLISDSGITTLQLTVYYNFKCYAVYDPNSVWATRELQENENPHKPSLKFSAACFESPDFSKTATSGDLRWR
jgi:hypothetical protein